MRRWAPGKRRSRKPPHKARWERASSRNDDRGAARGTIRAAGRRGLGWDVERLQGARHRARAHGGYQDPARALLGRPRVRRALSCEARALAQLNHPNIVTVIDRGEYEGRQFIVFE